MAKFFGSVGYVESYEATRGVWKDRVTERNHFGDVISDTRGFKHDEKLVDDVTISNKISIVADSYAINNLQHIRYVKYMDVKWKVININVKRPRLILTLGGVYNGQQT